VGTGYQTSQAGGAARLARQGGIAAAGLLVAVLANACGQISDVPDSAARHSGAPSPSATAPASPSDGLFRRISNPHCPGGNGIAVNTAEWTSRAANSGHAFPELAAAMRANGDTLVVASAARTPATAIAAEFRSPCSLNPAFGRDGATQLALPRLGVSITDVLPTADGGALVAGSTSQGHSRWLVGKLTPDGTLDTAFGRQGWALMPSGYAATTIALARGGDVVVGGDGNGNGDSFVREISAHGKLMPTFGIAGRVRMPLWHDGGVQGVWVEPNGDILSLIWGGNMGCWGLTAVTVTPSGVRVPGFTARFQQAMRHVDSGQCFYPVFIGDVIVGSGGFHLVGTAERSCVGYGCTEHPGRRDPSSRVSDIALNYDGSLDTDFGTDGATNFPAPIADRAWALPQADGSLLLATRPDMLFRRQHAPARHLVYRITAAGRLDTRYAKNGVATIPLPYRNRFLGGPEDTPASIPVSNGRQTVIAATVAPGNAVILIPVPTG
jgi:Domain of unknown function (DUF5122) beta-propeller